MTRISNSAVSSLLFLLFSFPFVTAQDLRQGDTWVSLSDKTAFLGETPAFAYLLIYLLIEIQNTEQEN